MAYLDTAENEDERQKAEGASLPGGGVGGGAPASGGTASRAPVSSGFQNLSSYFTANADQAGAQGNAFAADLEGRANKSLRSDDPGTAMGTLGEIDAAATPGGLATVLQQDAGPNYSAGMAGLDSYLGTRGADPGAFENLRNMFGDRLKKVEALPETPGERPVAPVRPDRAAFEGLGHQADRLYGEALNEYNRAIRDYNDAAAAYAPGVANYEAWSQRRAENIGEEYAPTYAPPDEAPASAEPGEIRDLINPVSAQIGARATSEDREDKIKDLVRRMR